MLIKVKRGRLWFIRCQYPIPQPPPDQDAVVAAFNANVQGGPQVNINLPSPVNGGPTLRPIRQPMYDSSPLKAAQSKPTLFHPSVLNGHGYYATTYNKNEVQWVQHQDNAAGFDTREEAEERAFELTTVAPWLIGKLEVVKLKTRRLG